MHEIDRITNEKSTTYMTDEDLREILIQRDEIEEKRFEKLLKNCKILDLHKNHQELQMAASTCY